MSSSVSYTALNQGRGDDRSPQPGEDHSVSTHPTSRVAPMAKAELDDVDNNEEVRIPGDTTNTNTNEDISNTSNVPRIAVTDADDDLKSNHLEDSVDGHLRDGLRLGDSALSLRDFRTGTPLSSRTPHVGLNFDTELGSIAGETIPDINVYQHKKTLAQGMMDLALFSANANQLRYVLDSYARHPYYWPSVVCICLSLGLQISIGIGLIWNSLYNIRNEEDLHVANKINNFTVIGIFLVVVLNVFISVFGVIAPVEVFPEVTFVSVTPLSTVASGTIAAAKDLL